jgi:hypothetical protein
LLLRNENVLRGRIVRADDLYEVDVEGGRIRVRASDVEFCCRTLEEGYQRKRGLLRTGDAREHLALALWCQRYGLLELAAQELAQAKLLDSSHPMIPLVEQRIKMSLYRPDRSEPARKPSRESPHEPAESPPSRGDLDRLVSGLPPDSVERFTQTVQPLLVNSCSTGACHGPASQSEFRLLRIPSSRSASRRTTQRNLRSVLAWVDRDDPAASKLLTVLAKPHGRSNAAVFKDKERGQYDELVAWVYWLAEKPSPVKPPATEAKPSPPPHVPPPWLGTPASHTAPVAPGDDSSHSSQVVPAVPLPQTPSANAPRPQSGGVTFSSRPTAAGIDPFSPDAFNRRFFPERHTASQRQPDPWDQFVGERQAGSN